MVVDIDNDGCAAASASPASVHKGGTASASSDPFVQKASGEDGGALDGEVVDMLLREAQRVAYEAAFSTVESLKSELRAEFDSSLQSLRDEVAALAATIAAAWAPDALAVAPPQAAVNITNGCGNASSCGEDVDRSRGGSRSPCHSSRLQHEDPANLNDRTFTPCRPEGASPRGASPRGASQCYDTISPVADASSVAIVECSATDPSNATTFEGLTAGTPQRLDGERHSSVCRTPQDMDKTEGFCDTIEGNNAEAGAEDDDGPRREAMLHSLRASIEAQMEQATAAIASQSQMNQIPALPQRSPRPTIRAPVSHQAQQALQQSLLPLQMHGALSAGGSAGLPVGTCLAATPSFAGPLRGSSINVSAGPYGPAAGAQVGINAHVFHQQGSATPSGSHTSSVGHPPGPQLFAAVSASLAVPSSSSSARRPSSSYVAPATATPRKSPGGVRPSGAIAGVAHHPAWAYGPAYGPGHHGPGSYGQSYSQQGSRTASPATPAPRWMHGSLTGSQQAPLLQQQLPHGMLRTTTVVSSASSSYATSSHGPSMQRSYVSGRSPPVQRPTASGGGPVGDISPGDSHRIAMAAAGMRRDISPGRPSGPVNPLPMDRVAVQATSLVATTQPSVQPTVDDSSVAEAMSTLPRSNPLPATERVVVQNRSRQGSGNKAAASSSSARPEGSNE